MSEAKEKSSIELKKELEVIRKKEVEGYYQELTDFLEERRIDLDVVSTISNGVIKSNIIIIDKL